MQTPEEFAAMLDRCAHAAEGMGERLTDTYRVADLIRARDAEVRADERAKVLAGFTEERRVASPSRIGYDANGHGWAYPATHERRLVGPWEPTP